MTDVLDVFETVVGLPPDTYGGLIVYTLAAVFMFMILFAIFDLLYIVIAGWR